MNEWRPGLVVSAQTQPMCLTSCRRWTQGCLKSGLCPASSEYKGLSIKEQPGPLAASVTWGGGKALLTTVCFVTADRPQARHLPSLHVYLLVYKVNLTASTLVSAFEGLKR